ncbi:MAG: ribonuclease P protein component [Rhodanobacteraceae bacterium]
MLRPGDFLRLRNQARRVTARHFRAEVADAAGVIARLGLAVSRRVSKSAVRRNRIKRVARESFRQIRHRLPPVDILLIARASAANEGNEMLRADLVLLWQRVAALMQAGLPGTMGADCCRAIDPP